MAGMVWRAGSRARPAVGVVVRGRVVVRLREGVSVGEVAARFGISDRTVRRIRDEDALVRGRGGCSGFRLSYVERVQIQMRCEAGESVRGIARGVERPASTVVGGGEGAGAGAVVAGADRGRAQARVSG